MCRIFHQAHLLQQVAERFSSDVLLFHQDPRCAKISVSGALHPCDSHDVGERCDEVGRAAIFGSHPVMKDWPEDHHFTVHELVPKNDGFWSESLYCSLKRAILIDSQVP